MEKFVLKATLYGSAEDLIKELEEIKLGIQEAIDNKEHIVAILDGADWSGNEPNCVTIAVSN
jgi:hypothetical protein